MIIVLCVVAERFEVEGPVNNALWLYGRRKIIVGKKGELRFAILRG